MGGAPTADKTVMNFGWDLERKSDRSQRGNDGPTAVYRRSGEEVATLKRADGRTRLGPLIRKGAQLCQEWFRDATSLGCSSPQRPDRPSRAVVENRGGCVANPALATTRSRGSAF